MKKSLISKIKACRVVTCTFYVLLVATCYAADVELPGDVQVTGSLTAGSFSGDGSGLTNVEPHYENTVIVSAGGTDSENGTALLDALDDIDDAAPGNPYLIKLEPGVYDIGTASLQMKQFVDIEGSGEITTTIKGNKDSLSAGVVMGAPNVELRFLTVENTGGGTYAYAIMNVNTSPALTNVTAAASGGSISTCGIYNYLAAASPVMTNVTASITGAGGTSGNFGIFNDFSSSPIMNNVTASVSGGSSGNHYGIYNYSSSPTMICVTASVSGGGMNYAVYNWDCSSLALTNLTATGSGAGTGSYGIYNKDSTVTMTNVTATASGAAFGNYGILNYASSATMKKVIAEGNLALWNYYDDTTPTSFDIYVDQCILAGTSGSAKAISNDEGTDGDFNLYVGGTKLHGTVDTDGNYTCVHCYDEDFTALGTNCQ